MSPTPPRVGPATFDLRLTDSAGRPVAGATVGIEGNMNHAGMIPAVGSTREIEPGRYEGALELTMRGDWFLLLDIRLPDGRRTEAKVDLPSVTGP